MQQKEFFVLSWAGFLVSFGFVLISIWNNDDWMLVERGFYTICLGWLTYSAFALVNVLSNRREGGKTGIEFVFLTWLSFIAAFAIGMISVYNTEWVLLEKGFYWMGLLFCTFTTITLAKEIRGRQSSLTQRDDDVDDGLSSIK
ncbi:YiaA/YiaB family inner membrane protein [Lysinibacillus sp. 54212]|uniref:YiaA/YiaB family inner membrane protein n=1 Tax=Lysinibacillus sp. 54212 TaxID=3119829 RepID=UPI002FCB5166